MSTVVVICTQNRAARLRSALRALAAQRGAAPFTVVVVDDASTDGTPAVLAEDHGLDLRTIRMDAPSGPSVARDAGWRAVDAGLVCFTDDDCEPAPDWLATLQAAHERDPEALLQGRTEPIERERSRLGPSSRTQHVTRLDGRYQCCNIAYPRRWLEAVDGFDRTYGWGGEDADLAWRCLEAGAPARFVDDAHVFHAVTNAGPGELLRRAGRFGDAMRLYRRHPALRELDLTWGVFWKPSHQLLLQAVVGAALARRHPALLLLTWPYLKQLERRMAGSPEWVPLLVAHDVLEVVATARGAARHRTFVL